MARAKKKPARGKGRPRAKGSSRRPSAARLWRRVGKLPWLVRWPLLIGSAAVMLGVVAYLVVAFSYSAVALRYDLDALGQMPERSEVFDRGGVLIGQLHGENRTIVPLDEVSPHFIAALLAREDNRFYRHGGVDYIGVARAMVRNIREREVVQGASTITMQLARNSYGIFEKNFHRKLTEVFLAQRIERKMTKDEIMEGYVNRIFYGSGIYGVEKASKAYFDKPARNLTLGESAMLAGIIRGPNRYSPFYNLEGATRERDMVLDRMVEVGRIEEKEAAAAKKEPLDIRQRSRVTFEESYALDAVRRDLDLILDEKDVEDGGFKIFTTLDQRLQSAAQSALDARLTEVESQSGFRHQTKAAYTALASRIPEGEDPPVPEYLQGALVTVDNASGGIVTVVGGRDFEQSQFNRALLSQRQVGSTFKPFVYTAAFEEAIFPGTLISDNPIRPGELRTPGSGNWSPQNSDGKFLGAQTAETGLVRSRNTMSVRVGDIAGVDHVLDLARRAGFSDIESTSPQIFIGNLGATVKTVASAFSIYPNNGMRRRPFVIDRILDRHGTLIYQSGSMEYSAISPGLATMVRHLLEKVVDSGTAASARRLGFKSPAGGKTGTTNDYQDAWFAGFNDRLTTAVWVGMDQPQRIMGRGYGSTLALPIWVDVMVEAEKLGYKLDVPRAEPALTDAELCRVSAKLATSACRSHNTAYTEKAPYDLVPREYCAVHRGTPTPRPTAQRPSRDRDPSLFDRIRSLFQ